MIIPPEIKALPFAEYSNPNGCEKYLIFAKAKIVNHEKMYIVDFVKNESRRDYYHCQEAKTFRVLISKKQKTYCIYEQDKQKASIKNTDGLFGEYDNCTIDEKSIPTIERLLGTQIKYFSSAVGQLKSMLAKYYEAHLQAERKKTGYIPDDMVYECPAEYPVGFLDFVRNLADDDYTLIYKHGNKRGFCHHCKTKVVANYDNKFYQYSMGRCPNCWEMVACIKEGSTAWRASFVRNVAFATKSKDGTVWFRLFHILRDKDANYDENVEQHLDEVARYAIVGNKVAMWTCEFKDSFFYRHTYTKGNWERKRAFYIYDGIYEFYAGGASDVLRGTRLQYANIDEYISSKKCKVNVIEYLYLFAKYPVVEYLYKTGYYNIIGDKNLNHGDPYALFWKRTNLKSCFKVPLRLLKLKEPGEWSLAELGRMNKAYQSGMTDAEIEWFMGTNISIDRIEKLLKFARLNKLLNYAEHQTNKSNNINTVLGTMRDYWDECQKLKLDMKSKSVLFPKDLNAAHARTMSQVKNVENSKITEALAKVAKKNEKYTFTDGELMVRVAASPGELSFEGSALHHCVGGYAERMSKAETLIFFVRKCESPDTPFFTLELKEKQIVQCRTTNNRSYDTDPKVYEFVQKWINKKIKTRRAV